MSVRTRTLYSRSAFLMASVAIAQLASALFTPFLARTFSPSDFGLFAIFFQTAQLLGATLALRYEQAVALQHTRARARRILELALLTTATLSLPLLAVISLAPNPLEHRIDVWLPALMNGALVSLFTTLTAFAINEQREGAIALSRVTKALIAGLLPLVAVLFIEADFRLLIVGEILANATAIALLIAVHAKRGTFRAPNRRNWKRRLRAIAATAYAYRVQPFWNLPQVLINSLSGLIVTALIVAIFSAEDAGAYFLMHRLTMLPAALFAATMAQAYLREAAQELRADGRFYSTFKRTVIAQVILGIVIGLPLVAFGPALFTLALGVEWQSAGELGRIYAPYVALHLVLVATSPSPTVARRQKTMLLVATGQNAVFVLAFAAGALATNTVAGALQTAVWTSLPYMILMLIWYRHLAATDAPLGTTN